MMITGVTLKVPHHNEFSIDSYCITLGSVEWVPPRDVLVT